VSAARRLAASRGASVTAAALAVLAALAGALTLLPVPARASDGYYLTGLRSQGGNVWHPTNNFIVEWDRNPPGTPAVEYTFRDTTDLPIPGMPTWTADGPEYAIVHVPWGPGVYVLQAWNHSVRDDIKPGVVAPGQKVTLYFDDVPPAPVTVAAPHWVAAGTAIPVTVSHPAAPLPISGIAGYAVTVDGQPDGIPCARADRCAASELALTGGPADDSIGLPSPPEGISYVHAVAVTGAGLASTEVATAKVGVDGTPPAVHLEGLPDGWAAGPVPLTAVADDPLSGMAAAGPSGPITALALDGAPPLIVPGDRASATVAGEGVHRVEFYGRDAVGNSGDGSLPFAHPGAATVRIDESGPAVRFAAPDPSDPERVEATVADPLSGPDPDRGQVAVRRVGSQARFQPLPTDARRGRLVARWSSDDFPRGAYEFRATGFDLAGNSTTSTSGGHGGAFVLQNPVKREAVLAFGFGAGRLVFQRCTRADGGRRCHQAVVRSFARRPAGRTVPCCHGALVGGLLLDAGGAPLAGQTVEVIETFAAGTRNGTRRTAIATDADGRFSTRMAPGPSRAISAEFPGTGRLTRAAGRNLRLRVRAAVHLRASTSRVQVGGPPVVFSGRIAHPEAPLPGPGLPVQLEFRLPGMPWTQFRTVQSDASGRFRYPYAFSDDDSAGVRFLFRASVAAAGDWPFAPATSRPIAVTG
jgi:hypothetical protein